MSEDDLDGFAVDNGLLEQHPKKDIGRGVELSTGSLGHGLSIGAGMALAANRDQKRHKVCVLMSDGELDEGSVWEAAMFAAHHGLDNLVAIVDRNRIQALGYTEEIVSLEPLLGKWSSFGWEAHEVDGHNCAEISTALESIPLSQNKPSVIVANTVKGKGVSFMEDELLWHYRCPDPEEYKMALGELS